MTTTLEVLDLVYAKCETDRENYATSPFSLEYLEGRCDGIEMAIEAIKVRDILESNVDKQQEVEKK